jgi:D-alanyl-D-alanine carboxypeptidase/D-alanyl-D-alanine-endopeptidase (penicillin-binding protein 4)
MGRRAIGGRRWGTACLAALGLAAATAGSVQAAPLPAAAASQIEAITNATPRYANSTWGIAIDDAVTGERLYARNARQLFVPASMTKLAQGAAALDAYGPGHRLRTPVHRIGRVEDGRLRGALSLVAAGDFSFGLRDRKGGKLAYADGGADHNEANSLGLVKSVSGDPLKALDALARDVRRSGITRATDAVIDDRLWETEIWPDGPITPIWVNENLIDITLRPTARGSAARYDWRPKTAAYRVVSRVRTGSETAIEVDEPRPGIVRVSGTIAAGGGSTVRSFPVDDPQAFARTAFIEALERAGVRVDARATGDNPTEVLPRSRDYPAGTRLGQWVSPPLKEYVNVVEHISYNRGADVLACLVGVRVGLRDCEDGLARATRIVQRLGVPGLQFNHFDGAGSDDRNKDSPDALQALNRVAAGQSWGADYRASLPVLGVPGGGDIGTFGTTSPARGKLQAKTGTRAASAPGAPAGLLGARGLSGYLTGASGRELLITVILNDAPLQELSDIIAIIGDQVRIVETVYLAT